MTPETISQYITETFEGVEVVEANGDSFFFFDPKKMFPFATLVNSDFNDTFSDLNRPSVFRLNIGVSKETFISLFGAPMAEIEAKHDFSALDTIMPHPVYGMMYWICALSPSEATFETVKPLLAEAYQISVKRQAKGEKPDWAS